MKRRTFIQSFTAGALTLIVRRPEVARAAAVAKPIIANPAVLLADASANSGAGTASMEPAISAALMVDEAVDGTQASAATNSSLNSAPGVLGKQVEPAQVLPMRLQQTVKESGLFYESHLGKWVGGAMSLDSIQGEPQAALAKSPGPLLHQPDLQGMPAKAANLASMQLNMLDGAPFVWVGMAWPGQNMEWRVGEHVADVIDRGDRRLRLPGEQAAERDGALLRARENDTPRARGTQRRTRTPMAAILSSRRPPPEPAGPFGPRSTQMPTRPSRRSLSLTLPGALREDSDRSTS